MIDPNREGISRRALLKAAGAAAAAFTALGRFCGVAGAHPRRPAAPPDRVSAEEVREFTRRFSAMIDEGRYSLLARLTALAQQQPNPRFRTILTQVRDEVERGNTLSGTMKRHPDAFDQHYTDTIRQGEVTGQLELMLHRLY